MNEQHNGTAQKIIADAEQKGLPWYAGLFNPEIFETIAGYDAKVSDKFRYDSSGTCGICEHFIPVDSSRGRCHGKGEILPCETKCKRKECESAVKFHRVAMEMTQKQLAQASGVNIRQIQRVENGEADAGNLTAKNLLAIADALGVDPHGLL